MFRFLFKVNIYLRNPSAILRPQDFSLSADDLWFLMHHSEDNARRSLAVTCYVDDSGTSEEFFFVVLGGVVMNRPLFLDFEIYWRKV